MDDKGRQFAKAIVQLQCAELRDFLDTLTSSLAVTRDRNEEKIHVAIAELTDESDKHDDLEELELRARQLSEDFPTRVYHSCFVDAYCFLEDRLCGLADSERKRRKIAIELSDLNHKGIEAAKLFLVKECGYTWPVTPEWREVQTYYRKSETGLFTIAGKWARNRS